MRGICHQKTPVAQIAEVFAGEADFAIQAEPRGTADAVATALRDLPTDVTEIIVLSGDVPLVEAEAMVELAHAFDIQVIAEGVEKEAQLSFLQELGCDYAQGYLLGVPSHAEHQFEMSSLLPLFAN